MKCQGSNTVVLACLFISSSAVAAHLVINREVTLSPHYHPQPNLITRASNGAFVIAGSSGQGPHGYPWAVRVDPTGKILWEYVDGPISGANGYGPLGERFYGAIDLPDQETLLCGVKPAGKARVALLIRIRGDGSVVDKREVDPGRPDGDVSFIGCSRWGDGFAILGSVSGRPKGTGWLVRLDDKTDFVWQKFADYYSFGDVVEAPNGGLFLISWSNQPDVTSVVKLDPAGELVASHALPADSSDWQIVHPAGLRSGVRVAYMLSQTRTDVVEFDDRLRGPEHTWRLRNAGVKAAVEMTGGSIAILGSQWHNAATASIAVADRNGNSQNFLMQPPYTSPWFIAAVQSGNPSELATVRQVNGVATLAWISIR